MHPYSSLPNRSFWSRSVSRSFSALEMVETGTSLISKDDRVVSAGSCFASNIVPYLDRDGFNYVRMETRHPWFVDLPDENLGYGKFSASYGNIYTPRQALQLLQRCLGIFHSEIDRWHADGEIIDVFRPGLRYRARSNAEFDALTSQHLQSTLNAFKAASVFIFTLGLTESWIDKKDGTVFPACPGTIAGTFDSSRHAFKNFSVDEIAADLLDFVSLIRTINPKVKFIITVSPVPLVATATERHVVVATTFSKSVLRVAADIVTNNAENCVYFPAYEIITGPQAPYEYFEPDRRNVSPFGVQAVMSVLLAACGQKDSLPLSTNFESSQQLPDLADLARSVSEAECDEMMSDCPDKTES